MYSFWMKDGLNHVTGRVPVHPLNIRWRDAYKIGGGMPSSTKLMEGFLCILLGFGVQVSIMLIKGFLAIRYIFDGEMLMKSMEGFLSDSIVYDTGGGRRMN